MPLASQSNRNILLELLSDFDAACCRLVTQRNTSVIKKSEIVALSINLADTLSVEISGGVFSAETDPLWMLSAGDDVEVALADSEMIDLSIVYKAMDELCNLCCPISTHFYVSDAKWCPGQKSVFAKTNISKGHLIGDYQGYYVHASKLSNERYNASVGGTNGMITVDPCLGYDEPLIEWRNSVTHRINEPPLSKETNCSWCIRKNQNPQIYADTDIPAGAELFIFYGNGFGPFRDYPVADNLIWKQCETSFDSDNE